MVWNKKKCIFNPLSHPFLLKLALPRSWVSMPEGTHTHCWSVLTLCSSCLVKRVPLSIASFYPCRYASSQCSPESFSELQEQKVKKSLMGRQYSTSWEANCSLDVNGKNGLKTAWTSHSQLWLQGMSWEDLMKRKKSLKLWKCLKIKCVFRKT